MLFWVRKLVSSLVCQWFGVVYPVLMTAKAAKQRDEGAYFQWVTYWSVWAGITVLDYTLLTWSLARSLPLYPELKVALILWLVLPRFQGAVYVFETFVLPTLLRYEDDIDAKIAEAGEEVRLRANAAANVLATRASEYIVSQGGALQLLAASPATAEPFTRGLVEMGNKAAAEFLSAAPPPPVIEDLTAQEEAFSDPAGLVFEFRNLLRGGMHIEVHARGIWKLRILQLATCCEGLLEWRASSARGKPKGRIRIACITEVEGPPGNPEARNGPERHEVRIEHCLGNDVFLGVEDPEDREVVVAGLDMMARVQRRQLWRLGVLHAKDSVQSALRKWRAAT